MRERAYALNREQAERKRRMHKNGNQLKPAAPVERQSAGCAGWVLSVAVLLCG